MPKRNRDDDDRRRDDWDEEDDRIRESPSRPRNRPRRPDREDDPDADDRDFDRERERPRRRRPSDDKDRPERNYSDDDDYDRPRRRKRRRLDSDRDESKGFSLIDLIPIDYTLQSNIGIGIYILGVILSAVIAVVTGTRRRGGSPFDNPATLAIQLLVLPFFIWGCMAYAKRKGYNEFVGLIGLASCLGLLVLVFLPDRSN
jgi:hypothetical protein